MRRRESAQKGRSDSKHAGAVHNWSEPGGGSIYFIFIPTPFLALFRGEPYWPKQGTSLTLPTRDKHSANPTSNTNLARNGCALTRRVRLLEALLVLGTRASKT